MKPKRFVALLVSHVCLGLGILSGIASWVLLAPPIPAVAAQSPSFVRVIHASPDVGTADVFVDGTLFLSSFQFGAVTDYAAIPAGPHKVQIALVGKGINAAAITQTLKVTPGLAYTVAAIGTQATGLSLDVFIDNNRLSPGTAKLRVYQLSPDAGSIQVTAGGKMLLSGIGYPEASNYLVVSAGSYTFTVNAPTANVTQTLTATLKKNTVTSLFAVGRTHGTPSFELISAQAAGLPGLPNTGSDPHPLPQPDEMQPQALWLLWPVAALSALLFFGSWLSIRRRIAKR